jgi:hypothetical protein
MAIDQMEPTQSSGGGVPDTAATAAPKSRPSRRGSADRRPISGRCQRVASAVADRGPYCGSDGMYFLWQFSQTS